MSRTTTSTALVLSVSGQNVTVDLGVGTETLLKLRDVSITPGDLAQIGTIGRARFVVGTIGAGNAPTAEPQLEVPPPAPQDITTGTWPFGPINPGTWRGGRWIDGALLRQGRYGTRDRQLGAAWYGVGPSSLPGNLTAATLRLRRVEGLGGVVAPSIVLLAGGERPDGPAAVLDSTSGPGLQLDTPSTEWAVPDQWLAALDDGTAAGLGCYADADDPVLALAADGDAMTLTCTWEDPT